MIMSLSKDLWAYIYDFIKLIPTLITKPNWQKGSIKFDIDELNCAYYIKHNEDRYIRKVYSCAIHDYNMINNLIDACNCASTHTVYPDYKPHLIYNYNYLAIWKNTKKGNKLIWHYVDIIQCDNCGSLYISNHIHHIDNQNMCKCCYSIMY